MRALVFAFLIAVHALSAAAAPSVCSYQGELRVDGQPFSGSADFKFAILCGGTTTLWSNDGTSANGSEPTDPIILDVDGGIFTVLLGDPELAMLPVTADLLAGCAEPLLRVWVDAGAGFEQLSDLPLASSPVALVSDIAARATSGFTVEGGSLFLLGGNAFRAANTSNVTTAFVDGEVGTVGCETLRFGDGTTMTTAPVGGADSDWIVNGNDMTSGVSGNVGIGTSAPDRKLHLEGGTDILPNLSGGYLRIGPSSAFNLLVDENEMQAIEDGSASALVLNAQGGSVGIGTENPLTDLHLVGDARVDGSNGNGIDTRNPNAPTAILRLGWMNDVARLRVGGSGLGSNGGLDIQGTSDASLLRILNSGDATLSGNLTVQGTLSRPNETRTITVGPFAFIEESSDMDVLRNINELHGITAGQVVSFSCTLLMPEGATMTQCEFYIYDTAAPNLACRLIRLHLDESPNNEILEQLLSSGTPGNAVLTNANLGHLVESNGWAYSAQVQWITPALPTDIRFSGLRLTYTMP
jgi:hypothetical protein